MRACSASWRASRRDSVASHRRRNPRRTIRAPVDQPLGGTMSRERAEQPAAVRLAVEQQRRTRAEERQQPRGRRTPAEAIAAAGENVVNEHGRSDDHHAADGSRPSQNASPNRRRLCSRNPTGSSATPCRLDRGGQPRAGLLARAHGRRRLTRSGCRPRAAAVGGSHVGGAPGPRLSSPAHTGCERLRRRPGPS